MTNLKLYTAATLTDAQLEDYSALHVMPETAERDREIERFRQALADAGIGALLTTTDEVGPGSLVTPIAVRVYELHISYYGSGPCIHKAYGRGGVRRLVRSNLISDLELEEEYEDEAEDLMPADIDDGAYIEFRLPDGWIEYTVKAAEITALAA